MKYTDDNEAGENDDDGEKDGGNVDDGDDVNDHDNDFNDGDKNLILCMIKGNTVIAYYCLT
uniref:Uncharacterized protein n=1 Tax=Tetranychus urticae TaxID=32264 RepID=T1KMK0_TETUR